MKKVLSMVGIVVAFGMFAAPASADHCGWEICGQVSSAGTVTASFDMTSCTATGTYAASPPDTTQDVCLELAYYLNNVNSCGRPGCLWTCAQEGECWILGEAENCEPCTEGTFNGGGTGRTATPVN